MDGNNYTFASLYAGIGGICLGLIQAGITPLWANEWDSYANITYQSNFSHTLYACDINNLSPDSLQSPDILTAGFPCQPFSIAGNQKGFEDIRGTHFFKILQFISVLQPKVVLLENVKNLLTHNSGKTFSIIYNLINKAGYHISAAVLDSKDYGNIPQHRERIYIICINKEINKTNNFIFPSAIPLHTKLSDLIIQAPVDERYYYKPSSKFYQLLHNNIVNPQSIYQLRRVYVRQNKHNLCPTLTANMGTGGNNVPIILSKQGIRKLTERECLRFQGFPDSFILPNIPVNELYKQIGNSVCVPVIYRIAQQIKIMLSIKEKESVFTGRLF